MKRLMVMVTVTEEADPMDRLKVKRGLHIEAGWERSSGMQKCDDRALVISTLHQAMTAAIQMVPFREPDLVVAPPLGLVLPDA